MKADIVAYRGPNFADATNAEIDTVTGSKRTFHYKPPSPDPAELVAIDLQPIAGLAIVYLPGDIVKWMVGNIELTFTVEEWRAMTKQTDSVIETGRHNTAKAFPKIEKAKAHEL